MNAEELLSEQIVENINIDDEASEVNGSLQEKKRERLSSVVAGGSSKQYLGKELQLSDIDKMTTEQINKLYCKYEARLGASMTKTLGNSFINLYVMGVSKPKRVAAGKKGAEVRIRNAELRKKRSGKIKKENSKIKQITKDSDTETDYESNEHIPSVKKHSSSLVDYKFVLFPISIVGLGLFFTTKVRKPERMIKEITKPEKQKKEIDPFEFN
ncbi:unnamed protein product [Mytilus coruscus]|uniref:Uncharacterized protein n=1 Tax=Mytilus coruscus TaxID=42192 RepID=A0A6J8CWW2_MYTCO|nr:unnamed protein product [Mytilus coruscus]